MNFARNATGDIATAHTILAGLLVDAERAGAGIAEFIGRTRVKFPPAHLTSVTEFPTDIHSIEAISALAEQLTAPSSAN
jgi:hypothetical protein